MNRRELKYDDDEAASYSRASYNNDHGLHIAKNEEYRKRNKQECAKNLNDKKYKKSNTKEGLPKIQESLKTTKISSPRNISKYGEQINNFVESDNDCDVEITNEKSRACKANVKPISQPYYNHKKQNKGKYSGNVDNVQTATSQQPEKINPEEIKIAVEKTECYKNAEAYKTTCIRINCSPSSAIVPSLNHVPTDVLEIICKYLDNHNQLNIIAASNRLAEAFTNSSTNLKKFKVEVNRHNISSITANTNLHVVQLRNLSIDFDGLNNIKGPFIVKNLFKDSIENLELHNAKFRSIDELSSFFNDLSDLKSLTLNKCNLDQHFNKNLPGKSTLKTIYYNKCNDNIFKAFSSQHFIQKITIRNDDWTWNGFPHEIVNDMMFNCNNIKHLVLIGAGTGSFFDSDNFSFKLEKLDTTMITFHWYVGIKNGRVTFLKTQLGHLKELTIHKLPFDFDGGKVLKFIIEEMGLQKFYYGKIPLILNGKKQDVKKFEANEIQIQSTFEMFRQYPYIKCFRFILSATDIASDEVEKVVNPPTDLFKNLEEFEVVDNSRYRGTLGVYLGLFKNLKNIKKLTLVTQDRNINTLLEEFLRHMCQLNEVHITSKAPRATERFNIIEKFVPNLAKISVASQYVEEARIKFRNVQVCEIVEK